MTPFESYLSFLHNDFELTQVPEPDAKSIDLSGNPV